MLFVKTLFSKSNLNSRKMDTTLPYSLILVIPEWFDEVNKGIRGNEIVAIQLLRELL